MTPMLDRRQLILSGTAIAAMTGVKTEARVAEYDPRQTAEGQVKLSATLDETGAFWVYSGVVYAVRPDLRPLPILTLTGCQSRWSRRQPDGSYQVAGTTMSFFRDVVTGELLDQFDNPITGKRNAVKSNILSGGTTIYPADGSSAHAAGHVKDAVIAPKGFREADPNLALGGVRWSTVDEVVMLMTDRSWNVAVQPQLEAQTQSGDRRAFFDPAIRKMPAVFTASTIIPWMTWMEMGTTPGHLVWHSSGVKGFSLDAVPADYRAKAGDLMDMLATRPQPS